MRLFYTVIFLIAVIAFNSIAEQLTVSLGGQSSGFVNTLTSGQCTSGSGYTATWTNSTCYWEFSTVGTSSWSPPVTAKFQIIAIGGEQLQVKESLQQPPTHTAMLEVIMACKDLYV